MGSCMETTDLDVMSRCPRFDRCSVPVCPLDPSQDERDILPGEPKCALPKAKRYAIGKDSDLPRKGLTKREWAGLTRWQGLSEAEKACQEVNLRGFWSICSGDLGPSSRGRGRIAPHPDGFEIGGENQGRFVQSSSTRERKPLP